MKFIREKGGRPRHTSAMVSFSVFPVMARKMGETWGNAMPVGLAAVIIFMAAKAPSSPIAARSDFKLRKTATEKNNLNRQTNKPGSDVAAVELAVEAAGAEAAPAPAFLAKAAVPKRGSFAMVVLSPTMTLPVVL